MKVLLINICLRPQVPKKIFPVGLSYVASAIYRSGFDLEIIDIDAYRYSEQELEEILRNKKFDVVAFGCIVTGYKIVNNLCTMVKKINRTAIIIVGNSVASSIPELLLSKTEADIAVIGEGDVTIVELLNAIDRKKSLENIKGIFYKKNGKILRNSVRESIRDINNIPFPEWELFDMKLYLKESKNCVSQPYPIPKEQIKFYPLNTARGCMFKCTFCYHVFRNITYRYRSSDSIINEIKELKRRYGVNYISFWDELTFFNKRRAESLLDAMIKERLDICWTGVIMANFFQDGDRELAKKFKRAGCVGLGYSLESANENILRSMRKPISAADFVRQKRLLDSVGLVSYTSVLFGYPEETEETIKETLSLCYENNIYPTTGFLLVQPGTPMYDYAIKNGFIKDEEKYLLNMGERQDFGLNMTNMKSEDFKDIVIENLDLINKKLALNLPKDKLIKTGIYRAKSLRSS